MPGPVPKRTETRRRKNKPEGAELVKAPAGATVTWPAPDKDWHTIARDWYGSLQKSGQSQFYEQSDVAAAYYVAEAMSRNLDDGRFSAQLFQSVMSAMTDLLVTEGARRRARVELERAAVVQDPEELAAVADFAAYQTKLGG